MKLVIQRVKHANVAVNEIVTGNIGPGLLVLVGVTHDDSIEDLQWLVSKLLQLRIFNDENGKMNLDVNQINGGLLLISQFTLFASTKKGNRPSFTDAATPDFASAMYNQFVSQLKESTKLNIQQGIFGADMQVSLQNDGPVTIIIDSKNRI